MIQLRQDLVLGPFRSLADRAEIRLLLGRRHETGRLDKPSELPVRHLVSVHVKAVEFDRVRRKLVRLARRVTGPHFERTARNPGHFGRRLARGIDDDR